MAKSGHTLHPAICRSDAPELGVVVVACGGHGEAMRKSELSCRGWKCNHPGGDGEPWGDNQPSLDYNSIYSTSTAAMLRRESRADLGVALRGMGTWAGCCRKAGGPRRERSPYTTVRRGVYGHEAPPQALDMAHTCARAARRPGKSPEAGRPVWQKTAQTTSDRRRDGGVLAMELRRFSAVVKPSPRSSSALAHTFTKSMSYL